jgi:hypothetical protein
MQNMSTEAEAAGGLGRKCTAVLQAHAPPTRGIRLLHNLLVRLDAAAEVYWYSLLLTALASVFVCTAMCGKPCGAVSLAAAE